MHPGGWQVIEAVTNGVRPAIPEMGSRELPPVTGPLKQLVQQCWAQARPSGKRQAGDHNLSAALSSAGPQCAMVYDFCPTSIDQSHEAVVLGMSEKPVDPASPYFLTNGGKRPVTSCQMVFWGARQC